MIVDNNILMKSIINVSGTSLHITSQSDARRDFYPCGEQRGIY